MPNKFRGATIGRSVSDVLKDQLGIEVPSKNKFNATRTDVDGLKFPSKAEARRYGELKLQEDVGDIDCLEVHPKFALHIRNFEGKKEFQGFYVADFRYRDGDGDIIIEDVKGGNATRTPLSRWKIKHFEAEWGLKVRIITYGKRKKKKRKR
jgi:hypothetical protein